MKRWADRGSLVAALRAMGLTPVQAEIAEAVGRGLTYREIAAERRCSHTAIKKQAEAALLRVGEPGERPRDTLRRLYVSVRAA